MKRLNNQRIIWLLATILLGLVLAACLRSPSPAPARLTDTPSPLLPTETSPVIVSTPVEPQSSDPPHSTPTPVATPLPTNTLPPQNPPEPPPFFGVETGQLNPAYADLLKSSGATMMRRNGLLWSAVEPEEGLRQWDQVSALESDLQNAASRGVQVILIVRSTPPWAQKVPGAYCGPVHREKLAAFARFMQDAVARYSAPPFNVKFWELGNEPDIDPSLVAPDSVFGCWGDENDPYYGGEYYARMLKAVYPAVKAADSQAMVLTGGLLMNCDPVYPPEGEDCKPSLFLDGILKNGGWDYFDMVSFHGYPTYDGTLNQDEQFANWKMRGGVVRGKVAHIREITADYGGLKPILHTEGGLLCPEWMGSICTPPGDEFFEAQADYVVRLYVRNWAEGIAGTIWYTFDGPGWRNSGMFDASGNPRPVYHAFQFLTQELGHASYFVPLILFPGVRGYEFRTSEKRIWVLWSEDEQTQTIHLPEGVTGIYDRYGNLISTVENQISIKESVYIELTP